MSIAISSWLRAFFAVQDRAIEARGVLLLVENEDVVRWPRTTGADVASIAAAIEPHVARQPLRYGGHGLARRWRGVVDGIAHCDPRAEYAGNRAFWSALPAVCVYLHARAAPLPPPDIWDSLFQPAKETSLESR